MKHAKMSFSFKITACFCIFTILLILEIKEVYEQF